MLEHLKNTEEFLLNQQNNVIEESKDGEEVINPWKDLQGLNHDPNEQAEAVKVI